MTRKEYMQSLKEKLFFLTEENRQGILDYYAEMLDDRMEDGQAEEYAVAAMEKPEEIASRLWQEQGEAEPPIPPVPPVKLELGDEAMQFSAMVDRALDSAQRAMEEAEKQADYASQAQTGKTADLPPQQPASSFSGFMDSVLDTARIAMDEAGKAVEQAAESMQSAGKEQWLGDYEKKVLCVPASQLQAVRLTGGEMPIQIRAGEGDTAQLVYYTCPDDPYEAGVDGGVLTLRRAERARSGGRFMMSMLGGMVRLWSKSSPTVELTLPREALVDLYAHTSNGSIKAEGLAALCDVDMKTSNSRIALKDLVCKSLVSVTSNARQTMENVRCKQDVRCQASNGRIEAQRLLGGREITLTTSNGRIVMEDSTAQAGITLTTSNGGIEIRRSDAPSVTLRTSNAGIRGALPGPQEDWAIQSGTSNGHNSLPRQQPGRKPLNVHTSNGSIDLHFE